MAVQAVVPIEGALHRPNQVGPVTLDMALDGVYGVFVWIPAQGNDLLCKYAKQALLLNTLDRRVAETLITKELNN